VARCAVPATARRWPSESRANGATRRSTVAGVSSVSASRVTPTRPRACTSARFRAEALPRLGWRIRLIRQPNRGKASALNRALVQARGRVGVTLDADTLLTPATVERLVAPFARDSDGHLRAVAGTAQRAT